MRIRKGVQVAPYAKQSDINAAIASGANLIRYQLGPNLDVNQIDLLREQFEHFKSLRFARANVILDLHVRHDVTTSGKVPDLWRAILKWKIPRWCNAVGILNEPRLPYRANNDLMRECLKIIRAEFKRLICVSSANGSPNSFKHLEFFGRDRIRYEAHMYHPNSFTHQGIYEAPVGKIYPTAGANKAALITHLKQIRDFQVKNRASILIGEFGVSTYADEISRANYFADVIDICRSYRWHWCAHAWREADVWNLETELIKPKLLTAWKAR